VRLRPTRSIVVAAAGLVAAGALTACSGNGHHPSVKAAATVDPDPSASAAINAAATEGSKTEMHLPIKNVPKDRAGRVLPYLRKLPFVKSATYDSATLELTIVFKRGVTLKEIATVQNAVNTF
jgi:hypothetical protein